MRCTVFNQLISHDTVCYMQSGEQVKQLGLIFMSEDDANALIEKVSANLLPSHAALQTSPMLCFPLIFQALRTTPACKSMRCM